MWLRETGLGDNHRGSPAGWAGHSSFMWEGLSWPPGMVKRVEENAPGFRAAASAPAAPPGPRAWPRAHPLTPGYPFRPGCKSKRGRVPEGGSQGSLDKLVLLLANWDGIPNKHPLSAIMPPVDSEVVRRCQQRTLARMELWPRKQLECFFPGVRDQGQGTISLAQG